MNIITTRTQIMAVVDRWEKQYAHGRYGKNKIEILNVLKTFDLATVSADQINEVIGNGSWTDLRCNECGKSTSAVIQLGEEPDWESATARICAECIAKAAKMMEVTPC